LALSLRDRLANVYRNPAYLGRTLVPDTYFGANAYATLSKLLNPLDWFARRRAKAKLGAPQARMERDLGYIKLAWGNLPEVRDCVAHALDLSKRIDFSKVASTKSFLIAEDLDASHPAVRALVTYPPLLAVISDYLGSFPVLQTSGFSRELPLWGRGSRDDLLSGARAYPTVRRANSKSGPAYD
jgi:hypothetical protein